MKTMLHIVGCFAMVLFVSTNILEAGSNPPDETRKKERANHAGWIGIAIQDLNKKIANKLKLDDEKGAYVNEVVDNSPADSAGIRKGDVVVEFNKEKKALLALLQVRP